MRDDIIKELIENNSLCVLATASKKGKPEAATIEYAQDEDNNLYFVTKKSFRKYSNIKSNPQGSIVITKAPNTLQMDGKIKELKGETVKIVTQKLTQKLGQDPKFYSRMEWKFMKFIPKEIRVNSYPKWPSRFEKN